MGKKKEELLFIPTPEDVDKVSRTAFELLPMMPQLESIEIKYKELVVKLKAKSDSHE